MRLVVTTLAFCLALSAQIWDDLRSLKAGDTVKVLDRADHEVKGAFRTASVDAITLATGNGEVSIERNKVRRVQVRSDNRRVRNAAIGVAIGVAIAVTVDQTLGTLMRNESGDSNRAVTYLAPIALFGGIGAALPGYRTVYKSR